MYWAPILRFMKTRTFLQTVGVLAAALLVGACDEGEGETERAATGKVLLVASSPATATTEGVSSHRGRAATHDAGTLG
jgi:hypothetical protein